MDRLRVTALVVAVAVVAGARLSATEIASQAARPTSSPTPSATPDVNPSPTPTPLVVLTNATAPADVSCDTGWSFFDNPILHYRLCYPSGWGFVGEKLDAPAASLSEDLLWNLDLESPESFPLPDNLDGFQIILQKSSVTVFISNLQGGAELSRQCQPKTPVEINGAKAVWCTNRFDIGGAGKPSDEVTITSKGHLQLLTVLLPFASEPIDVPASDGTVTPISHEGDRLMIQATTTPSRFAQDQATIWKIARSLRLY